MYEEDIKFIKKANKLKVKNMTVELIYSENDRKIEDCILEILKRKNK